jgi:hypothetical protein
MEILYLDAETDATFADLGLKAPLGNAWSGSEKRSAWCGGCERMNATLAISDFRGVVSVHVREDPSPEMHKRLSAYTIEVHPNFYPLLWMLDECTQWVAHNDEFDARCLLKYMRGYHYKSAETVILSETLKKLYDPMLALARYENAKHRKLDSALKLVLGEDVQKSGDGCNAVAQFWTEKHAELALYCADDVKLVRQLDEAMIKGYPAPPLFAPKLQRLCWSELNETNKKNKIDKIKYVF